MADSPNKTAKDLVSYKILSGGSQIKDIYQVFRITVDYALNIIPTAIISLIDGDVAEKDFVAANSDDFIPGQEIEIQAGYDGDTQTIFKGIVVSMRISLDAEQGSVLEITCRDKAILMTSTRKNAYYSKVKDSDIISTLVGNHSGLTADVDATEFEHTELVQYDSTDWDFMMIRADVNGLVASLQQGKVSVKKPDSNSSPVLSLNYGLDIIEFEANLNAVQQTNGIEAYGWDATSQAIVNSSGSEPSTPGIGNISGKKIGSDLGVDKEMLITSAQVDKTLLKSWADARLMKTRLSSLTGSATFLGSSLVFPNSIIQIAGVGDRFSGQAFVSAVTHLIYEGKWTTEIRFGMEDEWFAAKPDVNSLPASGLTTAIGGLMIGKVKKLDGDPQNENRIQVILPMMQDDTNAVWARLASYYSTNGKGNFFIPEINDEVVIGFLNNDPNYPVIMGSLYSSKNLPPYSITADNFTKAIVTKSDCKIEFDDEKKVINIQTPGGNKITFSDEDKSIILTDQNSNSIKTSTEGITIQDNNNNKITMSSSGIEINSTSNIKISSSGADVTVSGLNVTTSADISMKSTGNASAEFSASGQTTIKGAMVMIN
jgi:Rhs element Vgr protein